MDIAFFNKWLHLLSIIGVLGGTAFAWLVLKPVLKAEDGGGDTGKLLWKRFGIALGVLWLIVLATGFLNQMLVTPKVNANYQMLLGMKMGLALLMFVVSLLLAHPIPAVARFFKDRSAWLLVLLLLGAIVVGISAHLNLSRINGSGLKAPAAPAASQNSTTPAS
jgi:uncharacterized membrane protein